MRSDPRFRLQNDSTRLDAARWRWSVWVEAEDEALALVQSVRYSLHPTFPNPVRVVDDRASKFRLESSGWGEFTIRAHLLLGDGTSVPLERWILLDGEADTDRRPRVFVSASAVDQDFVQTLRQELGKQGVDVVPNEQSMGDVSVADALQSAIADADVVALVVSGPLRSFAEREVSLALSREKVVIPIMLGSSHELPERLQNAESLSAPTIKDAGAVADVLASRARGVLYDE